jgi:LPXTG-motif cell wall-anchored protein
MTVEWSPGYAILAGQIYTRAGYTQTGWSWSDGGAKAFELNQQVPITTNAVLYPYWESITKALYLTVNYAGNGAVRLSGGNVPNGWTGKLEPGQSYTFQLVPYDQHYVYSIFLAGWYRNVQPGNTFMVTYEMLQGQNQTIYFRFESVYRSPKTGDDSNLPLWAALGGLSLVGLAAILFMRRKK